MTSPIAPVCIGHTVPLAALALVCSCLAAPAAAEVPAGWPSPVRHAGGASTAPGELQNVRVEPVRSGRSTGAAGRVGRHRTPRAAPVRLASPVRLAKGVEPGPPSVAATAAPPQHAAPPQRTAAAGRSPQPGLARVAARAFDNRSRRPAVATTAHRAMAAGDAADVPAHRVLQAPGRHGGSRGSTGATHRGVGHGSVTHHRGETVHPPHSEYLRRFRPHRPAIPHARQQRQWKTPYSYGHFGAERNRHWSLHHGYREKYTEWRLW